MLAARPLLDADVDVDDHVQCEVEVEVEGSGWVRRRRALHWFCKARSSCARDCRPGIVSASSGSLSVPEVDTRREGVYSRGV